MFIGLLAFILLSLALFANGATPQYFQVNPVLRSEVEEVVSRDWPRWCKDNVKTLLISISKNACNHILFTYLCHFEPVKGVCVKYFDVL